MEGANLRSCNFEDPSGSRANCEGNICTFTLNLHNSVYEFNISKFYYLIKYEDYSYLI